MRLPASDSKLYDLFIARDDRRIAQSPQAPAAQKSLLKSTCCSQPKRN